MRNYRIDYISSIDDDLSHVWCCADNPQEAEDTIKSDYWDVKEILNVRPVE